MYYPDQTIDRGLPSHLASRKASLYCALSSRLASNRIVRDLTSRTDKCKKLDHILKGICHELRIGKLKN
jgi:hypothetical protein